MPNATRQRFMDIAFFNFPPPPKQNRGSWRQMALILIVVLCFFILVCAVCIKVGLIKASTTPCCERVAALALEFDFDFEREGAPQD